MPAKYVFVTGGVVSGLGKGITAASLGRLLKLRGLRVTLQKFDPYINVDPGTMNPCEHGEVFVTDDGGETDLDLGHYERFVDINLDKNSSITTGQIYESIINKERRGEFLGDTVQVIPHITNEIKDRIYKLGKSGHTDVVITEIGGTVGDIESLPFLEAIRQVSNDIGRENVMYIHVTLVPYLGKSGELKTKPTQHSVKELRSIGIQPDIIVCRTEKPLSKGEKEKIALFCNVNVESVIQNLDAEVLYEVPLMLEAEGLAEITCRRLSIKCGSPDLNEWRELVRRQKYPENKVCIGIVGKYTRLHDSYLSVVESLKHAGIANNAEVTIMWIDSVDLNDSNASAMLAGIDGILVPGGFGDKMARGIEGKISAIKYARLNKVPYFGICLGMQLAIVEFSRDILKFADANSSEFADTDHAVIDLMPEQRDVNAKGGTMRLGLYPCRIKDGTKSSAAYKEPLIYERHRHRYEVNNDFKDLMIKNGMVISGLSPSGKLVEMMELPDHPWFVGCQFHPEFKSRPDRPHPLFADFVKASLKV